MRGKKIIAGNWKMNPSSIKEAEAIFRGIASAAKGARKSEIFIFPPALYINRLKKISGKVRLGAEDASWSSEPGAFTGQISAEMLYDSGARSVILGHSERRFPPMPQKLSAREKEPGESNGIINRKVKASLKAGLSPILCVGETRRDDRHEYLDFVKAEVLECLDEVPRNYLQKIVLAYEPVWAIGKTAVREASPEEFREMKIFLRRVLSDKFGIAAAGSARILYGGSVDPKNAEGFLREGGADGFLIGRDSLKPKKFAEIIRIAEKI
jgi:triosephosphate isomerase (TIM)